MCFSCAVMTQTVQTNGVQPLSKTWELSLYELQRTPQVRMFFRGAHHFHFWFLLFCLYHTIIFLSVYKSMIVFPQFFLIIVLCDHFVMSCSTWRYVHVQIKGIIYLCLFKMLLFCKALCVRLLFEVTGWLISLMFLLSQLRH